MIQAKIYPYLLRFKEVAQTSRASMRTKQTYFLLLRDLSQPANTEIGVGEIALFKGLSAEDSPEFPAFLKRVELNINSLQLKRPDIGRLIDYAIDQNWPSSVRFGIESAVASLEASASGELFPSDFTLGKSDISINGLIWMGDKAAMFQRIQEKLECGFKCLKLKIGGINFEQELELLDHIRSRFSARQLTLRLDANCAFTPGNALERLSRLSFYDIHSIEQPLKPDVPFEVQKHIYSCSPIPIALDESLIGISTDECKARLLDGTCPNFIILKPSLCGGFNEAKRWIEMAEKRHIGWWITSALESNVGLNTIAQWTAKVISNSRMPQGLGTGALYRNNFPSPLQLSGEHLSYDPVKAIGYEKEMKDDMITNSHDIDNYFPDSRLTSDAINWWNEWNSESPTIKVNTSGSTDVPKEIALFKEDMIRSALTSIDFFGINENSLLLCPLSVDYIAGKMMIVRAEAAGARLIVCESCSLASILTKEERIDLLAIVPAQLDIILANPLSAKKIRNLLIGGAPLSANLEQRLLDTGINAFVSYGMTETCSHIALRRIGESAYKALKEIRLSVDSEGRLIIENDSAHYGRLLTNDIVELDDSGTSFRWIGRRDNVINSGGKKFFPEKIEEALNTVLPFDFYIVGRDDPKWGEAVTLVAEADESMYSQAFILYNCRKSALHPHALPKRIEYVKELPKTSNGKIKRI